MMEYDRVRLKRTARQSMRGQRPHPMLITLLFTVLVNLGSQLVSRILGFASGSTSMGTLLVQAAYQYDDLERALHYVLLAMGPERIAIAVVFVFVSSVIASLWAGIMRVGYSNFCLQMARGRQPQTGALFSAFPQWLGVLGTQFLAGLFRGLWVLLFAVAEIIVVFVAAALLLYESELLMMLIIIVSYIAMFVGIFWATLRYAMVDFLIADQHLTGMNAIRESKRLMKGNVSKMFILQLSFIGWYLVAYAIIMAGVIAASILFGSALAFGGSNALVAGSLLGFFGVFIAAFIGVSIFELWLTPYITAAQALFYDWARGGDLPSPGSFGGGPTGWKRPDPQNYDYSWSSGTTSGTGIGSGPKDNGPTPGIGPGPAPKDDGPAPKPPRPPKDDPWN